jgi:hypothetical protein
MFIERSTEVSGFNNLVVGVTVIKDFYAYCSFHDLLVDLLCVIFLKSNS